MLKFLYTAAIPYYRTGHLWNFENALIKHLSKRGQKCDFKDGRDFEESNFKEKLTLQLQREDGRPCNFEERPTCDFKERLTEYYYKHRGTLEPCAWWGNQPQSTIINIEEHWSLVHDGVANRDLVHGTKR